MGRSAPSLKRRPPTRDAAKIFVVYCEGRNTEEAYLEMLRKIKRHTLVAIESINAAGTPMTIAERATSHVRLLKRSKNSFDKNDEVWAVFDRDEHPNWELAIGRCAQGGVKVAYSNSCFELWLILHYQDHDAPGDRRAIQRLAERVVVGYSLNTGKLPDCSGLAGLVEIAELRAERQCERRQEEGTQRGEPSTSVWKLTRAIRSS